MHWAAYYGKTEALALLLQYKGDPNKADKGGQTAVHNAARYGKTEALELLQRIVGIK